MTAIDAMLESFDREVGARAERAEALGVDGLWTPELDYDPFGPLAVAADRTDEIQLGTRIATAFTRSPMVLAYTGWSLADFSEGRFTLGLGTQVQAHNERRFDVAWHDPTRQLREVVEAVRHTWNYWQGDVAEFDYDGEYVSLSLMTDAFDPGPIEYPDVPIYLAAVNEENVKLAGELADGICLHSFNTPTYTREHVVPWLETAAEAHGRSLEEFTVSASPFVITGADDDERAARREMVRMRIAFYASTPAYKPVMATHGWTDTGRELWELSKEGAWGEMAGLVTDEMVETFAVEAPPDRVADALLDTYGDVADRIAPAMAGGFAEQDVWPGLLADWPDG
jgi:probable F420-dependent oxidoreductase